MSVVIRGIDPDEAEEHIRAVGIGFGQHVGDRVVELEKRVLETERALAAVDGDRFVGGSATCSFQLSVPGAVVPCAGITSVAVHPTHRRRGILRSLMRRALDEIRGREPVSALWASEGAIYGRFGYGMATRGSELEIARHHTAFRAGHAPAGSVRLADRDEAMKLMPPVYQRAMEQRPGFLNRPEPWWSVRFAIPDFLADGFGKQHFFALHDGPEGPDGYAAYRIKHDWKGEEHALKITELIATDAGAEADLWRFCFDIDLIETVLAPTRSTEEPLEYLLADPHRLQTKVHDGLWVRLVDAGAALAARRYASEERLVLEVRDEFCPWNEGRYEVVGARDGAACRPTGEDPDLRVRAEDLGTAYLGGVGFRLLARAGRVQGDPEALARADRMFGWDPPPWCPAVF